MKEKIFKSHLLLQYDSPAVKSAYDNYIHSKLTLYNKISSIIITVTSFTFIIILSIQTFQKEKETYISNFIYILFSLSILSFILSFIIFSLSISSFSKNIKVQIIGSFVVYVLASFQFIVLKIILEVLYKIKSEKYFFINNIEYSTRIMLHFLGFIEFYQSFLINLVIPGITLTFYYFFDTINSLIFDEGASFIVLSLCLILSSYFVTKHIKSNYYYMNQLKVIFEKQKCIMNKLNTGYFSVKDKKISFINKSLSNIIEKSKINIERNKENNFSSLKIEMIFDILFNWSIEELLRVESEHTDLSDSPMNLITMILTKVKWIWKQGKDDKSDFVFIKYHTIELIDTDITYEISCRVNNEEYEFILNDITTIKKFEQKQYETKMKDVFLTKIFHEFKNPLVCVNEVIDQMNEDITKAISLDAIKKNIIDKCSMIKSFIDYCFILIYDLNYFTSCTHIGDDYISRDKIKIKDLMIFCTEIGRVKLIQENKSKLIQIENNISSLLPKEIICDAMKLKQILINVIAEAIQFTDHGKISIKFTNERENQITFIITYPYTEFNSPMLSPLVIKKDTKNMRYTIVKKLLRQLGNEYYSTTKSHSNNIIIFSLPLSPYQNIKTEDSSSGIINTCENNNNNVNSSTITLKVDKMELYFTPKIKTKKSLIGITIIIVDDEELSRKAMIRAICKAGKNRKIEIKVIEAKDGVETLNEYYAHKVINKDKIHAIISDEKMNFINGSMSFKILRSDSNVNINIPLYIVTAFDKSANYFNDLLCDGIYSKPLNSNKSDDIVNDILSKITIKNIM